MFVINALAKNTRNLRYEKDKKVVNKGVICINL